MKLYPLLLQRHLDGRLWGGQKLAPFLDLPRPYPERIAESWQVFDTNPVLNGPLAGMTLAQVTQDHAEKLVGTLSPARYGADFPLLAKFIDAEQDLSVQVHPDDDYAHRVEAETGFHGKNEAWYILEAEPGAGLFFHLSRPVDRAEFKAAVHEKTLPNLLNWRPVRAGDVIFVPAGTVHTINAGIVLFEIQQKSDLTYRVYDYGRPRPLHLEKALDVIAFDQPPPPTVQPLRMPSLETEVRTLLVASQHFAMERWELLGERAAYKTQETSMEILTVLAGQTTLSWANDELELNQGESVVVPATLGHFELTPQPTCTLLRCFVPQLELDIHQPLQRMGYPPDQIARVLFT